MGWRLRLAILLFLILLGLVLYLAIQVTPAVIQLPELDVPPAPPVPLYGQLPAAQWGKYVRMWDGEYRVVAPIKGQPKLYMDMSGNVIYPHD